ncbi:hypothetical protein B0T21DRAFT_140171 [Apiosordaria backusii]|uniref:Uncharacterized protein n=1 Tax=Apiosordaria backusii TaxID=314023 RepID=A0AA40EF80_9PEZI|nr:hypothetical protein B0T21DRAFT_140171 [Apiosordaria backusii]
MLFGGSSTMKPKMLDRLCAMRLFFSLSLLLLVISVTRIDGLNCAADKVQQNSVRHPPGRVETLIEGAATNLRWHIRLKILYHQASSLVLVIQRSK